MASSQDGQSQMGRSLLWINIFSEPLSTLYAFLGFILYKDLGVSAFQITLLTMLKPVITILSFYWSAGLGGKAKKLRSNVLWAGFWMRAPFLLCPWVDSPWYVIGSAVNYMFFYRAGIPGWLEMIRRNLNVERRGRAFSMSAALGYLEGVVLSLAMGGLLDRDPGLWKGLFFGAAILGMFTLIVQSSIPIDEEGEVPVEALSLQERVVRPWRDSWRLMRGQPDFARFQWGFMICGFGIMLIQPALPLFAVDDLGISYMEMAAAISIAKGLGFAVSSPLWARLLDRFSLFGLASAIFLSVGLFPVLLSFSLFGITWFYLAYFWYGVGQGGSHLVWNLSGPTFAGKEESSRYTGVSVVMAGLRGAVAPPLGGWLAVVWGAVPVLITGGLLSFYSGLRLLPRKKTETLST